MAWLGNGYTEADYNGSSRTTYLDPAMIDYPPVPDPEGEQDSEGEAETVVVSMVNGHNKGQVVIDQVIPAAAV